MSIPFNISKENILQAIAKIDKEGIASGAYSSTYDVAFNGKKYPPKLIVSYANFFANGSVLDRKSFKGGLNTDCFKLLKKFNFTIVPKEKNKSNKESFYQSLINFINEAQTQNLKTKHYIREYFGLIVKVSFG